MCRASWPSLALEGGGDAKGAGRCLTLPAPGEGGEAKGGARAVVRVKELGTREIAWRGGKRDKQCGGEERRAEGNNRATIGGETRRWVESSSHSMMPGS